MKHTPSPWIIKHEFNIVQEKTHRLVANSGGHSSNVNADKVYNENISNAKLIAAAPDLLEACKLTRSMLAVWSLDPHKSQNTLLTLVKSLDDAIQKAEK